jgi:hypothetical protein
MEKRLSLSQETTPRAPRVDKRARTRVSKDEEMKEIDEGTVSNLLNHTLFMPVQWKDVCYLEDIPPYYLLSNK